jgi:hypothetical protein
MTGSLAFDGAAGNAISRHVIVRRLPSPRAALLSDVEVVMTMHMLALAVIFFGLMVATVGAIGIAVCAPMPAAMVPDRKSSHDRKSSRATR